MEMRCQKCGSSVNADQAFCSKCGAVVGMSDTAQQSGDEWNMAATMVGKKIPTSESSRSTVVRQAMPPDSPRPAPPPQQAYTPTPQPQPPQPPASGSSSNAMILAVIGLVAVLLIGALLALLFYLNSQG